MDGHENLLTYFFIVCFTDSEFHIGDTTENRFRKCNSCCSGLLRCLHLPCSSGRTSGKTSHLHTRYTECMQAHIRDGNGALFSRTNGNARLTPKKMYKTRTHSAKLNNLHSIANRIIAL